jgi:hypothetical protein
MQACAFATLALERARRVARRAAELRGILAIDDDDRRRRELAASAPDAARPAAARAAPQAAGRARQPATPLPGMPVRGMNPDELQRALLDPTAPIPHGWPGGWHGVLLLFLVPIGGGIPAGVLLARDRGFGPPVMLLLYFLSDVILAFVFEPIMRGILRLARRVAPIRKAGRAFMRTLLWPADMRVAAQRPLRLLLVAFTVDPMTGRTVTAVAGHGFATGWLIAIAGDMLYFTLIMVSTLFLNGILGSGLSTIGLMILVMLILPEYVRRAMIRRGVLAPAAPAAPAPAAAVPLRAVEPPAAAPARPKKRR